MPAGKLAFQKQAERGTLYVEFSIPTSSMVKTKEGRARILGPNSPEGRLAANKGLAIPQMPNAKNIAVMDKKP